MSNLISPILDWLDGVFRDIPLEFLEIFGRFGLFIGVVLAVLAYGRFTFRCGDRWAFGRERQEWNTKAMLSFVLTMVLVIGFGILGSKIVIVPGAQTLESLKDMSIFVCVLVFGFPALLAVTPAYMLSDLIEGLSPTAVLSYTPAYITIGAYHWIGYQLFGKNPDFRKASVWAQYGVFVLFFLSVYSPYFGYVCGPMTGNFPSEISYRIITPALFATLVGTWIMAPFAMLGALPLARKLGLFWAEIPGHVRVRRIGGKVWEWQSGPRDAHPAPLREAQRLPIHLLVAGPSVALVLVMVALVAFVAMRSGEASANQLAERLHREMADNIQMQVNDALSVSGLSSSAKSASLAKLLEKSHIAKDGRAFILDRDGRVLASSAAPADTAGLRDPVVEAALESLREKPGGFTAGGASQAFRFDIVTAAPLSRETWLAQLAPCTGQDGELIGQLVTAIPESNFLGAIQAGKTRVAVVITIALVLAMVVAMLLGGILAQPLRRLAHSADVLAQGDLAQRVSASQLAEVNTLADAFNHMGDQLQTSFERTRASEEKLRTVLDTSPLPISWVNSAGVIEFWNRKAVALFGYSSEEIDTAEKWFQLAYPDPEYRKEVVDRWNASGAAGPDGDIHRGEYDITCKDGRVVTTEIVGTRFGDLTLAIFNDITERKLAEEELRRHRDHLEELVAARTEELKVALDAAQEASRAKSAFLATMSHEIRTPMNGVLGMAELLSQTPLEANQRVQLAMLRGSGEDLLTVINDILDFSKIEAGRMELETIGFSLHDLMGRTLQALAPQATAKNLEIELAIPDDLPDLRLGDPNRLRQVLTNLAGNAIKFTERGWVRVVVAQGQGPDGLRVEVIDTGEGINPEAQAKLFQPFSQADASTTRKHGGTGLGLVISARIIKQMGGRTGVISKPGCGSTFWFELSLPPATPEQVAAPDDRMPDALPLLAGKRVLLVDDNSVNRAVAGALMRRWGMTVSEATDGPTALAQVRAVSRLDDAGYDLAVLDGAMPGMDGWQLAAAIREVPGCAALPLVMASSSGLEVAHSIGENSLFRRFLLKPMRPAQLAGALAEALTGWQPGQAAPASNAGSGARVLLVEDTKVNQMVARAMLEKGGHQVTLAENGVEALAQLEQPGLFDIILMDCQMPEMDGFEATRQLRQREQQRGWQRYRVVAMTANAMESDRDACLEAGMDGYLAKPVRMEQLLKMVAGE